MNTNLTFRIWLQGVHISAGWDKISNKNVLKIVNFTGSNKSFSSCITGATKDLSDQSEQTIQGVDAFDFTLANLTKNHTQFGKVFSKLILALESNSEDYHK